ncbi:ABC transporter ATP-binding protein [uncultured Cohaesibacter sp.]|uniref:ABC transporter ATP-binding protein n=1 Tax=uncultured Cohaesibacter sp. TaxID=1002546 RepID=UPI00292DA280|nr:ABC transporter ATP-binding protein [uncultured Cohaesibacter sp.]
MFSFFEKRVDPFAEDDLRQPPKAFWSFIWYYSKPYAPYLGVISILSACIAIIEVNIYGFMGDLVNWLSEGDKASFFAEHGADLWFMAILILVIMPVVELVWQLLFHQTIMGNFPTSIRWLLHRYLLRQSMVYYQDEFAGRISQKVMQTAMSTREIVTRLVDVLVYVSVYFTTAALIIAQAKWQLMVPMIVWLIAYLGVLYHFVPRLRDVSKEQADRRSEMVGKVVDAYSNISIVKLFSHASREDSYAKTFMVRFIENVYRMMRLVTSMELFLKSINHLLLFSSVAVALYFWQLGQALPGDIALITGLIMRLLGMSEWILFEVTGIFENIGTVQDGIGSISKPHVVVDKPGAVPLKVTKGEIVFDKVCFDYGKDEPVVDNLSLTIRPGEKIGLVGRSGAGKSTLINLLLRFHDLNSGAIRIDGQSVADIQQDSLRSQIGVVTQDTSLLHRSVMENINYGKEGASEEEARQAAVRAQALDFIAGLKDHKGRTGLRAHVGERGIKLSGGQRQRIAIARVLLKNAPILVLDEATSALDSEVEAAIQDSLNLLMDGKTVLAIAHRLSTIASLDRLIVMDQGQVVEMGTHEELLQKGGLYSSLWDRQSGGFIA